MVKKSFIWLALVFACIFSFSYFLNDNHNEKTLTESMKETKREKEKMNEFMKKINEELVNNGYEETNFRFSNSNELHIITVQVQDKEYLTRNGKKIKTIIHNLAKELKLNNIKIQFETVDSYNKFIEENNKSTQLLNEVSLITSKILEDNGYKYNSIGIESGTSNPKIEIKIEGTKGYYNNVKDKIQKLVSDAVSLKTKINFDVNVKRRSEAEIKDEKWQPIFSAIREETDKKFKEYKGFSYSFHPEPLQIIIRTDLPNSKWYWNSEKKAKQIKEYVNEIIKIKVKELSVKKIPYEIIIMNKENKKIK